MVLEMQLTGSSNVVIDNTPEYPTAPPPPFAMALFAPHCVTRNDMYYRTTVCVTAGCI